MLHVVISLKQLVSLSVSASGPESTTGDRTLSENCICISMPYTVSSMISLFPRGRNVGHMD